MTPRPRAPTLRAVANLTITLSPEQYARVLSLVPANEVEQFCITAIDEAIARRRTLAEKEPKQKAKPGPKASVAKATLGVYIEKDLIDWLRAQMRGPNDIGAVVASVLRQARAMGIKAFSDEPTIS